MVSWLGNKNLGMSYGNLGPESTCGAYKGPWVDIQSQCTQAADWIDLGGDLRFSQMWLGHGTLGGLLCGCETRSREMWTVHTPSAVPTVGPLRDISMSPA